MNFFHAIILGVIEGITEFLPISSTFHLILASKFLGLKSDDFLKLFEVFIQSGAILAIILLYLLEFKKNPSLIKKVLASFIPTAIIGFALRKTIKDIFFEDTSLMLTASFLIGLLFIIVEILIQKGKIKINKSLVKLSLNQAAIIGLFQAAAIIPGVSRSGATILGLLLLGFNRPEAALYSFLLAVPTIFAASGLDLISTPIATVTSGNHLSLLLIGFITAFIFAFISVRWLINYLKNHSLILFGLYRLVLSPIIFLLIP